jgi:tryptophan synthase beta chain
VVGLASYASATDDDAVQGFLALARTEGILPALEPAHVIGWLRSRPLPEGTSVLVNLSGRGDKDLATVAAWVDEHGTSAGGEGEAA